MGHIRDSRPTNVPLIIYPWSHTSGRQIALCHVAYIVNSGLVFDNQETSPIRTFRPSLPPKLAGVDIQFPSSHNHNQFRFAWPTTASPGTRSDVTATLEIADGERRRGHVRYAPRTTETEA